MAKAESYSVAELEQMLQAARQAELSRLIERRDQLASELAQLERQIEETGGGPAAGRGRRVLRKRPGGGRSRNQPSLKKVILEVLQKSKKPISTSDVVERVQAAGYKSSSDEFRKVVYLNLFNLKKAGEIKHDPATKLYSAS